MTELDESVYVDEGIGGFLWRIRRIIMVTIIMLLLVLWVHLLLNDYRVSLAEYRTAFAEIETTNYVENSVEISDFSSANLDRVDDGVYRLRVEVSGDYTAGRRVDTPVDFDRDLRMTVTESALNGILLLHITNERDDIIIQDVEIRGKLISRELDDFHQVFAANIRADLGYNETSRGVPISIFATDEDAQLQLENWRWLTDLEEFGENFKLHYMEITFRGIDEYDEADDLIRLRYTTLTDFYEIIDHEDLRVYDEYAPKDVDEE